MRWATHFRCRPHRIAFIYTFFLPYYPVVSLINHPVVLLIIELSPLSYFIYAVSLGEQILFHKQNGVLGFIHLTTKIAHIFLVRHVSQSMQREFLESPQVIDFLETCLEDMSFVLKLLSTNFFISSGHVYTCRSLYSIREYKEVRYLTDRAI